MKIWSIVLIKGLNMTYIPYEDDQRQSERVMIYLFVFMGQSAQQLLLMGS